jgi:hypothetical protein
MFLDDLLIDRAFQPFTNWAADRGLGSCFRFSAIAAQLYGASNLANIAICYRLSQSGVMWSFICLVMTGLCTLFLVARARRAERRWLCHALPDNLRRRERIWRWAILGLLVLWGFNVAVFDGQERVLDAIRLGVDAALGACAYFAACTPRWPLPRAARGPADLAMAGA